MEDFNIEDYEEFDVDNVAKMSTESLQAHQYEIENEWERTGHVYSMTDYSEIIRELTIRELNR